MALAIKDRVKETSTTTGTGTYTLGGAVTGFETFTANLSNADTTYYACTDNTDFEVGIGTFTSSGTTLARTTILASSNSNSAVNWSSGTRTIFMTYPADKAVFKDASDNINGTFVGNITGNVTGNTSGTAATVTTAAQSNITSLGTLTTLTVDNVIINGTTIGHTDDTDLITLADGVATVAGEISVTTLDIGGTNVTSTAAELNVLDGIASIDTDISSVSGSDDTLASAKAIKTYVDAKVTAEDLDVTSDSGTIAIDLDSETLTIAGGTGLASSASSNTVTLAVDASQTGITSILATDVKIGEDDQTKIDFETANQINFYADNTKRVTIDSTGLTVNSGSLETATIDYTDGDNAMTIADGGAVTFAQVPVFPDDTIETADIQDNAVTLAKMAGLARGKLITGDSSGDPSALAIGTNGQYLKSDGNDLVWGSATISGLACDDLTVGDAAVTLSTSSGNITIDAQGNDTDIIFKGTDGSADTTFLTLDGSDAGTATFNSAVNAGGNVTITSTDAGSGASPSLSLYRNSSSPATWDLVGELQFKGENSADEVVEYATLVTQILDKTDGSEDGRLAIQQMKAGTLTDTYLFDHDRLLLNDEQTIRWNNHAGTSYEVDLVADTPTASRTITLPDATGTVVVETSSGTVFSDNVSITTADNTDTLVLISTDADASSAPNLDFYRNSSSPADGDGTGKITWRGRNDNSQDVDFATIDTWSTDVSDGSEGGEWILRTMTAGTSRNRLVVTPTETVFNQEGIDANFRVEGDGNANLFKIDAGNDRVGIGTDPTNTFSISASVNTYVATIRNTVGSGNVFANLWRFTTAPNDNTSTFLYCDDGDGATNRLRINSNGNVYNANNTYGQTSDERIKQDITDANSQWDDIKALKVRNFKKKSDVRQYGADKAPIHLGFVAQELEAVSPKLIDELPPTVGDVLSSDEFGTLEDDLENPKSYYEDGDTIPNGKKVGDAKEYNKKVKEEKAKVKGIKYSILYMKAVKALQEAMTRIETLETSNADLIKRVKALEDA